MGDLHDHVAPVHPDLLALSPGLGRHRPRVDWRTAMSGHPVPDEMLALALLMTRALHEARASYVARRGFLVHHLESFLGRSSAVLEQLGCANAPVRAAAAASVVEWGVSNLYAGAMYRELFDRDALDAWRDLHRFAFRHALPHSAPLGRRTA